MKTGISGVLDSAVGCGDGCVAADVAGGAVPASDAVVVAVVASCGDALAVVGAGDGFSGVDGGFSWAAVGGSGDGTVELATIAGAEPFASAGGFSAGGKS